MDLSVLPKDEIWFLHVRHHILDAVYHTPQCSISTNADLYYKWCTILKTSLDYFHNVTLECECFVLVYNIFYKYYLGDKFKKIETGKA